MSNYGKLASAKLRGESQLKGNEGDALKVEWDNAKQIYLTSKEAYKEHLKSTFQASNEADYAAAIHHAINTLEKDSASQDPLTQKIVAACVNARKHEFRLTKNIQSSKRKKFEELMEQSLSEGKNAGAITAWTEFERSDLEHAMKQRAAGTRYRLAWYLTNEGFTSAEAENIAEYLESNPDADTMQYDIIRKLLQCHASAVEASRSKSSSERKKTLALVQRLINQITELEKADIFGDSLASPDKPILNDLSFE